MTQQGLRQASARNLSGFTTGTNYNEDLLRLFDAQSVPAGTFDERQLRWINARLGSSYTDLREAMHVYATGQGAYNWSAMGALEAAANFTLTMPFGSVYTRVGVAAGVTTAGVVEVFAANAPQRTDRGLALEPAAINLLLRSREFDNATWVKAAAGTGVVPVVTANDAIAPDGTLTADKVVMSLAGGTGSGNRSVLQQSVAGLTATASYNNSYYVKGVAGEQIVYRSVNNNAYSGHTFTGGWDRIDRTETAASVSSTLELGLRGGQAFPASNAVTFHIWEGQLVLGTVASSPITTTSTVATRSLPVFTEIVPLGYTKALLVYADATTTLITSLVAGAVLDLVTAVVAASKGRFGSSELVSRTWQA
jgi:hypothetical protein